MPKGLRNPLPSIDYLHVCFYYNDRSGDLIWRTRPPQHFRNLGVCNMWNGKNAGKIAGTRTGTCKHYLSVGIDRKLYLAHRIIWKMMTNQEPAELDHMDREGLNNRWLNLRKTNPTLNCVNRSYGGERFGTKGIRLCGDKYQVILYEKGYHSLGSFSTLEEAVMVRRAAERLRFGGHVSQNSKLQPQPSLREHNQ